MSDKKIAVNIFTGFLGAGKTTLINALIDANPNKKIGVIINEFGQVGVDSDLIQTSEEMKKEISNGCACCVVRTDLQGAAEEMVRDYPDLDYLFIEASGLAEPLPIAQTFVHNITLNKPTYLDSIICVVDSQNFLSDSKNITTLKEQLEYSDFIVLTKSKENAERSEAVKKLLAEVRPESSVLEFDLENKDVLKVLLDTHSFTLSDEVEHAMQHDHDHEHNHFEEVVYFSEKSLDPNKLDAAFNEPEFKKLIRAKGFLNLHGQSQKSFVFQLVGHGRQLSEAPFKQNQTRLVMIGKHLNKEYVLAKLAECEV